MSPTRPAHNNASCVHTLQGWGWSFVVPGLLMIALAVLINLFLVVHPNDVGLTNPDERSSRPLSSGIITGGEEEMQPLKEGKDTGLHAREKVRTGTGSSATGSRDEPQGLVSYHSWWGVHVDVWD